MSVEITDEKLLSGATEFAFGVKWPDDENTYTAYVTRKTNHGRWIEDEKWAVCIMFGSLNPWYLGADGYWRYKAYHAFDSAREATEALFHSSWSPQKSHKKAS